MIHDNGASIDRLCGNRRGTEESSVLIRLVIENELDPFR